MTFKEVYISIHALLTESDSIAWSSVFGNPNFNPRSPHGERRSAYGQPQGHRQFQSTLSSRRATAATLPCCVGHAISIHALLTESDCVHHEDGCVQTDFNPRSPHGERRHSCSSFFSQRNFNPRSPHGERPYCHFSSSRIYNFNPRSPHGERQQIPPNWPYRFCLKCQFKDGEKSKKAKGSASAQASSPAYEKNKVRIPWGDFECFRFAPIK